ncbi:outer membrane beta-barrel family protein [Chryseobacterium jejuense]|uniref:outer membrane beta-barrel family protein n=1 Tax=Chryseobacterium jejuense TaxID=445960 RepID=UPI001AE74FEA|nr:outer membrane beta-barrel family protein [Chryseobacterium jejuense]MBP2618246.1 outer membrane receptor protein involved in Fe transport [Chryseobacterium jejuense]
MKKIVISTALLSYVFTFAQAQDTLKVKKIETITVEGKKKLLVERKVDRLIYNISSSVASQGVDGVEALSSTPLIKVDENSGISIVGKSGVAIMVNERMLNLSGSELMNYLKSLRSENIEKIEVITTPPAKYEAQGNSGLINIVLKKNQNLGWSGSLTTSLRQTTYPGVSNSTAINYQSEKLSSSLKLRQYNLVKRSYENYTVSGADGSKSNSVRKDFSDGLGANLSMEYRLSSQSTIGFIYDYGSGHSNMNINSTTDYFQNGNYTNTLLTYAEHRSESIQQTISAYYDLKFGKRDNKFSITGNYFSDAPKNTIDFTTTDNSGSNSIVRTPSEINYKIYSAQADLILPFEFVKTETGIKFTNFDNNSDVKYQNLTNGNYMTDPTRSNIFEYNEKNYAAYLSLDKKFGEKWSVKAGLRYEYSVVNGNSVSSGQNTENSYGKLFPTAYITYKQNENNTFSFNYSKRIKRPDFRAINPYRWYTNANSYFSGNPLMSPSFNHNFELAYIYKGKLSATAYFQREVNVFRQFTTLQGENSVSTYQNMYNQNNIGVSLNYSDTFFRLWEVNYSANFAYMKTQVFATDVASRKGSNSDFDIQNNFSLNKDKTVQFFLNYLFSLPSNYSNVRSSYIANFTAGFKLNLMDKNLLINASVADIFRQSKGKGTLYYTNSTHYIDHYWDARRLNLSVTYTFGNKKVKETDHHVKFDEKNRAQ